MQGIAVAGGTGVTVPLVAPSGPFVTTNAGTFGATAGTMRISGDAPPTPCISSTFWSSVIIEIMPAARVVDGAMHVGAAPDEDPGEAPDPDVLPEPEESPEPDELDVPGESEEPDEALPLDELPPLDEWPDPEPPSPPDAPPSKLPVEAPSPPVPGLPLSPGFLPHAAATTDRQASTRRFMVALFCPLKFVSHERDHVSTRYVHQRLRYRSERLRAQGVEELISMVCCLREWVAGTSRIDRC